MNRRLTGIYRTCFLLLSLLTGYSAFAQPANDDPCNALPLTVSANGCNYIQSTNQGATNTPGIPAPGCGMYAGHDVWYSAVVPTTGSLELQTQALNMTDGAMAVYGGSCSALTLISCNDDFSGVGTMPGMILSNLTPGSTVYIRMWSYNNSNNGTFRICAGANTPLSPNAQDCPGAIPICQNVYSTTVSYSGTGNIPNEINPANSCLMTGERNDVWYTFTVQNSGNLNFTITPVNMNDDYDWAVYNLTNANCASIASNAALSVSCNYSATAGTTGPTGGSNLSTQPATGTPYNQVIPVTAGQTYVVNVSNYSATADGYTIDFGASTATIFDNVPPQMATLLSTPSCGSTQLTVRFSENILCSSLQDADFNLTGPGGPYSLSNWSSPGCASGGTYGNEVTVTVSPAIHTSGSFSLCLTNTSGSVTDLCGNVAPPACLSFTVNALPVIVTKTDPLCPGGSTGTAAVSVSSGTVPYTYAWTPNIGNTAAVTSLPAGTYNVLVTDSVGCAGSGSVTLTDPAAWPATAVATPILCYADSTIITITASGGAYPYSGTGSFAALAGTYTYTVTDANGCTAVASVSVTQPTQVTATASGTNPTASGAANGSAVATPSGGTAPYTFVWSNGATSATDTGLVAGTYSVIVTDANNCSATATVVLSYTPDSCSTFRPFQQGRWGSSARGNSPNKYLYSRFRSLYPNGLTIGSCGRTLHLSSAVAVTNFLPSSGNSRMLDPGALLDPTHVSYGNSMAGELVALNLNLTFDSAITSFSPSVSLLRSAIICQGQFINWTVQQLYDEANRVIGCGGTPKYINALTNAMTRVNGAGNEGQGYTPYLRCPSSARQHDNRFSSERISLFPNPSSGKVSLDYTMDRAGVARIEVYTLTGQVVYRNSIAHENAGEFEAELPLAREGLPAGMYIVRVNRNGSEDDLRLVLAY